jgi:hypothetical protein
MSRATWRDRNRTFCKPGPWDNEPDKVQWIDKDTGLMCLIKRAPEGHLCGYVAITNTNCLWGSFVKSNERPGVVYGGISYSGVLKDPLIVPSEDSWWFGFQCANLGDLQPSVKESWGYYRDLSFATDECTRLAKFLNESSMQPNASKEDNAR